tara:strand:+ start:12502 stop:12783 length:282 start_codon:yes stop_codon:yes gene_type:complete
MLLIDCPFCGAREEHEFHYGGQAHIIRPDDPDQVDDKNWADYMYYRKNTMGLQAERWQHSFGCGQWFNALRCTQTHDFKAVYKMGEAAPEGIK